MDVQDHDFELHASKNYLENHPQRNEAHSLKQEFTNILNNKQLQSWETLKDLIMFPSLERAYYEYPLIKLNLVIPKEYADPDKALSAYLDITEALNHIFFNKKDSKKYQKLWPLIEKQWVLQWINQSRAVDSLIKEIAPKTIIQKIKSVLNIPYKITCSNPVYYKIDGQIRAFPLEFSKTEMVWFVQNFNKIPILLNRKHTIPILKVMAYRLLEKTMTEGLSKKAIADELNIHHGLVSEPLKMLEDVGLVEKYYNSYKLNKQYYMIFYNLIAAYEGKYTKLI